MQDLIGLLLVCAIGMVIFYAIKLAREINDIDIY